MQISSLLKFSIVLPLIVLFSESALSWGNRGHHSICTSATHLVKDDALRPFLRYRMHSLGHLCNIPDIYWKSLGADTSDVGNPTHYIDPEILGMTVLEIPKDIKSIMEKYTGTENKHKKNGNKIFSIPKEMGSLWWRADQFYRLVSDLKMSFSGNLNPKNYKEEQDDKLPYNQSVFNMIQYMGLMGHFVGDASQPFHATVDFDGYGAGHGGIHSYYEEQVVTHFGPDMEKLIVDKAKSIKDKKLTTGTPIEIMQYLSSLSYKDIEMVLKADPISKKSEVKNEKGMDIKTAAERNPSEVGYKKFKDLIVLHMARSAIVLAHFWDESYHNAGSPSLQAYKSFRYPHTPEFIPPDYLGRIEPKK
ncbi:MAG: hypothetical protein JNM24_11145 [Bdellovibrionaceae bacterium]|nr:hypothetical protein [Pseudobdellovibrionaceae bacterium]